MLIGYKMFKTRHDVELLYKVYYEHNTPCFNDVMFKNFYEAPAYLITTNSNVWNSYDTTGAVNSIQFHEMAI